MTNEQLAYFKTLFENMLLDLKSKKMDYSEELLSNGDEIDRTCGEREKALNLKLQGREKFFIKKIEYALTQIESNTFGLCYDCLAEIDFSRLKARPTANYCITCKEEREREEEHIPYHKRSHTLGKTFAHDNVLALPSRNIEEHEHKIEEYNQLCWNDYSS